MAREPGDDDGEEKRYPFEAWPLSEFVAIECKPIAWLVPGLVPAGGLTITVSAPNAGKTLLAFDYAARVAAEGRRVLVMEEEGGQRGCQERLRRAAEAHGLDKARMDLINVAWNSGLCLTEKAHVSYLIGYIQSKGIEYAVLDSLSAMARGVDENDSRDMSALAENLHQVKAITGCAVHAQHHTTKEAWKPGQTPSIASARGHGALAARADAMIALVPVDQTHGFVNLELYNIKQRDAERADPQSVRVMMTGPAAIVTSDTLERSVIDDAVSRVRAILPAMLKVIPIEGTPGVGHIELFRRLGKRDADSRQALRLLLEEKTVIETVSGKLVKKKPETNA